MVAQFNLAEADSEEIMYVVFELKQAAERADELAPDGAKYCHWSKARVDASDLKVAISRHLLNRDIRVPEHIRIVTVHSHTSPLRVRSVINS
jgi:hypothetical protein